MAWGQELVRQGQIILMDQKGEFPLWIGLSAVTSEGHGDLSEADHLSLVRNLTCLAVI
jgi:hypothetical protein